MAIELEEKLEEESELVKSSGGIFEVHDQGTLIYSKKETKRFPKDSEVFEIIQGVERGLSVKEAQAEASAKIPDPPTFFEWLQGFFQKKAT